LTDLVQAVGLNKTTTYRLLTALESEHMVARNPETGAYRLGPGIIALGGQALRANDLRATSRPELERLARETGETATLEILADGKVLILDEVVGRHLVGTVQSIGTRWPAHATSTGKVLLAHLPEAERPAVPDTLAQLTPQTVTAPDALQAELAQVRRAGYATAIEELELGFVAAGAPLFDCDGRAVAAISVGGPALRLTVERLPEIASLVVTAAERISHQLGHQSARTGQA
jgi:DNA-binding IclR family transcriptional regulator